MISILMSDAGANPCCVSINNISLLLCASEILTAAALASIEINNGSPTVSPTNSPMLFPTVTNCIADHITF